LGERPLRREKVDEPASNTNSRTSRCALRRKRIWGVCYHDRRLRPSASGLAGAFLKLGLLDKCLSKLDNIGPVSNVVLREGQSLPGRVAM
jgi:hypothetical protein